MPGWAYFLCYCRGNDAAEAQSMPRNNELQETFLNQFFSAGKIIDCFPAFDYVHILQKVHPCLAAWGLGPFVTALSSRILQPTTLHERCRTCISRARKLD